MFLTVLRSVRLRWAASVLCLGLFNTLAARSGFAQYTAVQNFTQGTTAVPFTLVTAGQYFSGPSSTAFNTSNSNINPVGNVYTSSPSSYGVLNNNGVGTGVVLTQLDFAPVRFVNSSGSTITMRLAAFSIGNNQGLNNLGSVVMSVSTNLTPAFTPVVTITGPATRSAYWGFNAPGQVATTYPTPITQTITSTGDLSNSSAGIGTIVVNLPAGVTQAAVRLVMTANDKSALAADDLTFSSASPLPVTLTGFSAARQGQAVMVKWATATEKNNAYFEVLRSNDGKTFGVLSRVKGQGTTSSSSAYTYTDNAAPAGTTYYQLRQVDLDGTTSSSSVAVVAPAAEAQAIFYPNPSNSSITLPAVSGGVAYRVYSITGSVVASGKSTDSQTVDVQHIPAGVYILELTTAGKRTVQRFVRQ